MVFQDLETAEKFKSIFEDMAVADIRVALLWAARTGVQKTSKANLRERGQSERAAGAAARASAQRGPATRAREIRTHFKLPSTSTTTRPRHARDGRLSHATPLSPLLSRARNRFPQAGDDEFNRHVIRHHHKKGEPHKAIEYCLEQVEKRLANGGTFLHDTIKTHGAPTT